MVTLHQQTLLRNNRLVLLLLASEGAQERCQERGDCSVRWTGARELRGSPGEALGRLLLQSLRFFVAVAS